MILLPVLLVLGFLILVGSCLGYVMSRAAAQSGSQRKHLIQFWFTQAFGFFVFVVPVLALMQVAPKPERHEGFWTVMSVWFGLTYLVWLVGLVIWVWQWWRDLPRPENGVVAPETVSRKRLVWSVALGSAVPVLLLVVCLFAIFFESNWRVQGIPATTVERIINETKDAKFQLFARRDGSKSLWITLPGRKHMRFDGPANEHILALLAERRIAYRTYHEGETQGLDDLGGPAKLLLFLSAFLVAPAGGVLLLLQSRAKWEPEIRLDPIMSRYLAAMEPHLPIKAEITGKRAVRTEFDKTILALRTDRAPSRTFGFAFAGVFLFVMGASALLALKINSLGWYSSAAVLKIEGITPRILQEEVVNVRSDAVLEPVARRLDLNRTRGRSYNHGRVFTSSETLKLMRRWVSVRAVTNYSQLVINASAADRAEAAKLANAVAEVYRNQRDSSQPPAEFAARAMPAPKHEDARVPAVMIVGGFFAILLGSIVGGTAALFRAWLRRNIEPPKPKSIPATGTNPILEYQT